MHWLAAGLAVLTLSGCLREKVPYCDNGAYCPEPLACTERAAAPFCGPAHEVAECFGKDDEATCTMGAGDLGYCNQGLCTPCDPNNAACDYGVWTAMDTGVAADLYALWIAGPRDVYVAGKSGTFLHWDGRAWTELPKPVTVADVRALAGRSATDIFSASGSKMYRYDGTAWTPDADAPSSILGLATIGDEYFASGIPAMTGHYAGGWMFTSMTTGVSNTLSAVGGLAPTDVFAVGSAGFIIHWNGSAWSAQPTGSTHSMLAVAEIAPTNVYAAGRTSAGTAAAMLHYDGAWTDITASLPAGLAPIHGVWAASPTDVFAVAEGGKIIRYTDAWALMPTTKPLNLNAVVGLGTEVFAVGDAGTVLRYRIP